MIRLIASDLDGTLLKNGAQKPTAQMIEMIGALRELNIRFVAASGRQYPNLKRMLAPVWRDIIFAAENGAVVFEGDRVLCKTGIPEDLANELIRELYADEACDVQVSGVACSYFQPKARSREWIDYLLYETKNTIAIVDDITCVTDEIVKISALVYDEGAAAFFDRLGDKWKNRFQVAVSGRGWVDFTLTSKGEAIRQLQNQLGISKEQTAAFGDNFNDRTMFGQVRYSYAMNSAEEEIRQMARHCCESVESVVEKLITYLQSAD